MSKNKIKQLANHCWNKEEKEIKAAIEKAVEKGMITEEEIEEVRRRIEENKKKDAKSKEEEAKRKAEREKAREAERVLRPQQEEIKKQDPKLGKLGKKEKKDTPKIKKLQSAVVAEKPEVSKRKTEEKPKQEPPKEKRTGRVLSLPMATKSCPLGKKRIKTTNDGHHITIREFSLFPDIGIEISILGAVFTEKKDCFVANLGGVLIKIPKELRYEDNLKGVFSLIVVKVQGEKRDFHLNLIYRRGLNGSEPVYVARIDSEKEDPIPGSIHTTPTTIEKMILHLYPKYPK